MSDFGGDAYFHLPGLPAQVRIPRRLTSHGDHLSPETFAELVQQRSRHIADCEALYAAAQRQIDRIRRLIERISDPVASSSGMIFSGSQLGNPEIMYRRSRLLQLIKGHEQVQESCRASFWSLVELDRRIRRAA